MSSRFPPSSGFNSRDRSPQRFGDRRPPAGPRGPDDASPAPFGRDPPRGPRALVDSPRGGPFGGGGPRGRGYGRELDRDWGRRDREFDPRENRMSFGRGRSRSPTRDFRDMRDPPGRDLDLIRMRRNSRDSLLSASSGGPDGPPSSGGHPRGGSIRGRGRGDWDGGRGRGRPPYLDDRETFRRRSRSRDGWRDRGRDRPVDRDRDLVRDRERDRDLDRRFDRRDDWDGRRLDRDDRPSDPWKRPPSRAGSRAPSGSTPASLPHAPPVALPDRIPDQTLADQDWKASLPSAADPRRDAERAESVKDLSPVVKHSSPPAAPQVPAFGSVTAPIPSSSAGNDYADKDQNELPPQPPAQPPTGPKAGRGEQDPLSRVVKASTNLSELSPPTAPAAMTKRDSIPGEPLPPGRSSSVTSSPTFARLPHPRAASPEPSASPQMQPSNVPTGPRALQQRQGSLQRGMPKGSKQWVRPGYPRAPSLANAPAKRESIDEHGPTSVGEDLRHGSRELERDELSPNRSRRSPPQVPTVEKEDHEREDFEDSAPVLGFDESEEEEDDENIVFTQDYLEERKQIFEKDMRHLRAEMPPPPLEDQTIVALLMNIQLLGMVALEPVPERPSEPVPSVERDEQPTKASAADRVVSFASAVMGREPIPIGKTVIPPVVSHEEITIDSLPFLHSGPPTPISDMEVYQENTTAQDQLKDTFRNELSKRQKEIAKKNATLREEYMSYYKPWRLAVWDRDRHKDHNKSVTPGPVSPPAPVLPPTPAPIPEGREGRRYKGNSELDFLNALKASEISAQEELERRRTKMATARPDLSREAVIPDMMEPHEEKAGVYKDMNNIIEPENAMAVFGFVPRPNDFSPEEHTIFTDAFMAHPKRWGKIAESLPGRDFQQCIVHYYLTKEEIKYKAKLNKRWSRRGRGKAKSSRPKSNALIADLGVVKPDFEGEEEPQVTDTGRPRRAAAPTFGGDANEVGDGTAARRGQAGKDGEAAEKPAGRRGARAGGPRTQRRGRAAQQEQKAQAMQGIPMGAKMEMGGDGMLEGLPLDAADKEASTPMPRGRAPRGRTKEGMYVFESTEADIPAKQPETGYGSLQPTSYWSVPEQRDFPQLLEHFGRDFEGISNFMKTKTTVMVKNYYQRRLDSGKKDFEECLLKAEENKARGEPTGPLPVPSVAPKRRYEATPSSIVPRPLAPHGEIEADEARFSVKGKPGTLSPQPMPMPGRPLLEKDRSRYPPLAQAVAASTMPPSLALGDRGGLSHRMPGPRLGYFTDDRRDSSILSAPRMDPLAHGPSSLLPPQASMGPSQQAYMSAQQPPSLIQPAHSRQPSLTQRPGSPSQLQRQELDLSSVHRDSFAQRPYYGLGQPGGLAPSPRPVLSPVKDVPRTSATPAPESARQVPAKRSNIMSILNDEPEEPQPRKRFASEHIASTPPSRSIYQPSAPVQQHTPSSRGYSDYPGYGATSAGSGPSANNDWMARFDPRAQQGSQPPPPQQQSSRPATSLGSQSFSPYAPAPSQPSASLSNLPVPSPAPTPPPQTGSQRSSYPNVFSQPPSSQAPPPSGSREGIYRPGSPPPRYGSSSNLLGMPPRPSDAQSTYASAAPPTPAAAQPHNQSYQQHVQGLVSGSQSHRSNLPGGSPQYGHSTPPPSHGSRSNGAGSMPSLASFGRSYTPPPAFHPSVGGGYPPPSSGPGSIPPLHQRPPPPGENASTPTHQRAYSQGNNLPPPSQPPH
ncbi:hypothetical protein N7474_000040 [Penicillium riverlandense]|uniref:uncharacterized protein n=1 Tax=Penicillium riverlandense TaxID=1903569 RepID=UPI0025483586|nr:uncharacterized protein N7474_000040 [Penicillium riverlandense]KAJ5831729.1 hypothetical protein N7474_000040 [Penicillium riverlandense]